jgi:hypothetical protein
VLCASSLVSPAGRARRALRRPDAAPLRLWQRLLLLLPLLLTPVAFGGSGVAAAPQLGGAACMLQLVGGAKA